MTNPPDTRARLLALTLWLALCTAPALALEGDDKQPMLIEADNVELDETQSTSVYVGNVQVDQGSMRLLAEHVTVYHFDDRRVKYIIALGDPVNYKQLLEGEDGEMRAFAKRMDYDAEKDELILTGDAILIQGEDRLASERIVYDRARERMRAGGSGRVKIKITPEPQPEAQPQPQKGTGGQKPQTPQADAKP